MRRGVPGRSGRKYWYVDNAASGANNGTSWANAWTSFASISWGSISPLDVIFLSGGTSTKTYSELMTVGASGSAGKPITITNGVDAGHNGTAIIDGGNSRQGIDTNSKNYIIIDKLSWQNSVDVCIYVNTATAGVIVQRNTILASGPSAAGNARGIDIHNCTGARSAVVRANIITTAGNTTDQTDCIYASGCDGIVIDGNTITVSNINGTGHSDGIQVYNCGDVEILRNKVEQSNASGDSNNHGMWLTDTLPGKTYDVHDNLIITRNATPAISHWNENGTWTGKIRIYGNTIYHNNWGVNMATSSAASEIKNNIIYQVSGFAYVFQSWTPTAASQIDYNLVFALAGSINDVNTSWASWQGTGRDAHGVNSNPSFVNAGTDFHIQTGSPAKNAGTTLAISTTDLDGNPRPQGAAYDIGCYEFV